MPCKHLPKTDLIHRQEMRPLRHGGSQPKTDLIHRQEMRPLRRLNVLNVLNVSNNDGV